LIDAHPALRRGVLYIEDFDDPPGTALTSLQNAHGILVPSFSAEELEAARQQAYAEGCRDGQQSAALERDHAVRLLLESLDGSLAEAQQAFAAEAEKIAEKLARTLLATMCGSLPEFCRAHGEPEARSLVRRVMPGLAREPRLEIRVHPDLVAAVQDELSHLNQDLPEKLTVIADHKMEPTDFRAAWSNGYLLRSAQSVWREVREQLTELGLLAPIPDLEVENQDAG
jgi:flagellar assembly protein FliH